VGHPKTRRTHVTTCGASPSPGTQEVKVRYKFVTTEVPGGYFGTQYNDYFNVSIRTQAEGGAGTESQTMNGLGLSSFDGGGATDWREFDLPVNVDGDTVQVDMTVANFREYATFEGKRASDELFWFSRISIIKTAGQDQLAAMLDRREVVML
jgi:hypothetical protein